MVRRPRGGVSAAAMPAYAAPRDIGAVAVWDELTALKLRVLGVRTR